MKPLRNGDLSEIPGAAELIDSAQDAAKKLARCCAEKDAENARLREAIQREANRHSTRPGYIGGALVLCNCEICRIAREGR